MTYIVVFLSSMLLLKLADCFKSRRLKNVLQYVAILLPCLLAGLRADTIGTDIKVYVKPMFEKACDSRNFFEYLKQEWLIIWRYVSTADYEIGFTLLVYIVSKVFGSLSAVLFAIQAMIMIPIYAGLKKMGNRQVVSMGVLVFFAMNFNPSLNMMRQWIAMAWLFYGSHYMFLRKYKKYLLFIVLAVLFHTSALMGLPILIVYHYTTNENRKKIKMGTVRLGKPVKMVLLFIIGIVVLFSLNGVAVLLQSFGLGRFAGYINGNVYVLHNQILLRLPMIVLYMVNYKTLVKKDEKTLFYGAMFLIDLLTSQLISINTYAFRISAYFSAYYMLIFPALCYQTRRNRIYRALSVSGVVAYLAVYWWYFFVYTGMHATYPYILG